MVKTLSKEKMVSLLYMSEGGRTRDKVIYDALNAQENITAEDYYLVAQMPLAEMFGKTPSELLAELGAMTAGPDWMSTGRRQLIVGDVVCVGQQPYISIIQDDVPEELEDDFQPVTSGAVMKDGKPYVIGLLKLNAPKLKGVCNHVQS